MKKFKLILLLITATVISHSPHSFAVQKVQTSTGEIKGRISEKGIAYGKISLQRT